MAKAKKEISAQDVIKELTAQRDAFNKKARKFARKAEKADAAIRQIEKVLALNMTMGEALQKAGFKPAGGPRLEVEGGGSLADAFKPTPGLPAATVIPQIKSGAKGRRTLKVPPITCTKEA